jgi:hypothetical protein
VYPYQKENLYKLLDNIECMFYTFETELSRNFFIEELERKLKDKLNAIP